MKVLFWLLYLPLLVVVAAFGAANRHDIGISFDPLPFGLTAPVFAVVLASALIGLVVGGISAWMSGRTQRKAARMLRRQNALLETEIAALREQLESSAASPPEVPAKTLASPIVQRAQDRAESSGEMVG